MTGIDFVRPDVRAMHAYEEEATAGLNLQANTNLFGVNPALERALAKTRADRLTEYPSLGADALRQAAAKKYGVAPESIVTGNGSNDLIDVLMRTFVEPGDRVAFHTPTFSMIPVFVRVNHGRPTPTPLGADWSLDADALLAAEGKVTIVVRPNNPTGNAFPRKDVERVVHESRGIVVVDEAYVEFLGGESFVREVRDGHDRLIVLRTLSKAHGMAGLRVGFGIASSELATELNKVRGPFRVDALAENAGISALSDDRYLNDVVAGVKAERPNLRRMLEERGFTVFRSDANFVLTKPPVDAQALASELARVGIHVRDFQAELAPYLRMTVGPPSVTARLRIALDDALPRLKEASP